MADGHSDQSQMANGGLLRPVMSPGQAGVTSPPWSRVKSVLMYRFAEVTIYLGFAFIVTIFDICKSIINYQVDHLRLTAIFDF